MTLLEELHSKDFEHLLNSLNAYALSRLKLVGEKDFDGRTPLDFVGDLILKIIEGQRKGNMEDYSFKEIMFGALKSEISNFLKSKHLNISELPEIPVEEKFGENGDENRKEIVRLITNEGADDDEVLVFELWVDGINKPREIAKELGIDVTQVYNISKRLERRIQKIKSLVTNFI